MALSRRLHFRCRSRREKALIMPAVPSFSMAPGMWRCVVKSLNHPQALRGFQNEGDWDRFFSSTNPIHIVYPELSNS